MWSLCYQDDIAPRAPEEIGQTEDNKFICEKSYTLNTQSNSSYASKINFQSINNYEWLGANASSFNLGFFNSKNEEILIIQGKKNNKELSKKIKRLKLD